MKIKREIKKSLTSTGSQALHNINSVYHRDWPIVCEIQLAHTHEALSFLHGVMQWYLPTSLIQDNAQPLGYSSEINNGGGTVPSGENNLEY